jgi:2-keto-3-deoxy-L-rhamnonate aldolase RhmA
MYFKERLAAGHCLIGAGIYSNSPDLLELAAAGMDWVWWETQHSHVDWQTTVHGVRTAYGMRIPILVRTWTHSGDTIERLLDTGAEGIIVPMINTAQQAEAIVSRCYYPPIGSRSCGSVRMDSTEMDLNEWNKRIATVVMIETPEAVRNAEAISNVRGVDGLLVGARDLAIRVAGRSVDNHAAPLIVRDELAHVVRVCQGAGKAAGVIALTPEELRERIHEGYRLICAGMDVNHLEAIYRRMREASAETIRALGIPC